MKLQLKIKCSKRIITMSKQQFLMTAITMSKQQFLIPSDFALFYQVLIMLAAEYCRSRYMWLLVTFYGTKTTNRVPKSLENVYFLESCPTEGPIKSPLSVCPSVSLLVCSSVHQSIQRFSQKLLNSFF